MATSTIAPAAGPPAAWPAWSPIGAAAAATASVCLASYALHKWASSSSSSGKSSSKKLPPGPSWFWPYIGETPEFIANPTNFMWRRFVKYKSTVFRTHILGTECIIIGDPELLRGALSDIKVASARIPVASFNKLVGDIYMRSPDRHKIFRKEILQTLLPTNVKVAMPEIKRIMTENLSSWVQACKASRSGTVIMDERIRRLFLHLGIGPLVSFSPEGVIEVDQLLDMVNKVHVGLFCVPIYFPGTQWYQAINSKPKYLAVLAQLLEKRFPPAYPGGPLRPEADIGVTPGIDLTAHMLKEFETAGESLKAKDMAEPMMRNIIGATETTANIVFAAICATACREDVQRKIREEQAALIKQSGSLDVSWVDLGNMPYTDAVAREVMRLMPSAHAAFRLTSQDVEVAGYTVPAGSHVALSGDLAYALDAHDMAVAEGATDPETLGTATRPPAEADISKWIERSFRPERWLKEGQPRGLWQFGFGPHQCPGRDLAIMETKLMLSLMARGYAWTLPNIPKPRFSFLPFTQVCNGRPAIRFVEAPLSVA